MALCLFAQAISGYHVSLSILTYILLINNWTLYHIICIHLANTCAARQSNRIFHAHQSIDRLQMGKIDELAESYGNMEEIEMSETRANWLAVSKIIGCFFSSLYLLLSSFSFFCLLTIGQCIEFRICFRYLLSFFSSIGFDTTSHHAHDANLKRSAGENVEICHL